MKFSLLSFLLATLLLLISCGSSEISDEERTLEALAKYSSESSQQSSSKVDSAVKLSPSPVVPKSPTIKPRDSEVSKRAPSSTAVSEPGTQNPLGEDHLLNA